MVSPGSARGPTAWMSQGACLGKDPELFFPITATGPALRQITAAKAVCGQCAVRLMCLAYALATRQAGVWGGTTTEERHTMGGQSGCCTRQQVPCPAASPAATGQAGSPSGQ
jgi:WhiB family redox-sensing transcriptional regulator